MARRVPRDESLSRVYGVGALFSAAYGNVGSSIYYALGVTAAFALGLTPVAFVIAGLIFMFTAASYTEATVMYPEAGGSSSFARHAFNELISFIAAWGQMLNYIITVAISAFFVVLAVLGLYLLIPVVALSAMPVHHLPNGDYSTALGSKFAGDPILGIVENLGLGHGLTQAMRYYVGVLAAVILLIATNAGLIG